MLGDEADAVRILALAGLICTAVTRRVFSETDAKTPRVISRLTNLPTDDAKHVSQETLRLALHCLAVLQVCTTKTGEGHGLGKHKHWYRRRDSRPEAGDLHINNILLSLGVRNVETYYTTVAGYRARPDTSIPEIEFEDVDEALAQTHSAIVQAKRDAVLAKRNEFVAPN